VHVVQFKRHSSTQHNIFQIVCGPVLICCFNWSALNEKGSEIVDEINNAAMRKFVGVEIKNTWQKQPEIEPTIITIIKSNGTQIENNKANCQTHTLNSHNNQLCNYSG